MDASKIHADNLHVELQAKLETNPTFQAKYHKSCVTKYLTKANRLSEKQKREASGPSPIPVKRTRSSTGDPFDWLTQCFYCGKQCKLASDPKHPERWNPAYLIRETEKQATIGETGITESIERKIKDQCDRRADKWAADILDRLAGLTVRAADLHAADARYHKDCYSRFFSGRSAPGGTVKVEGPADTAKDALQSLVDELYSQRNERWDSVWLMERFLELGGKQMRRSALIKSLCETVDDLVVLTAPGYRSVVFLKNNSTATLKLMKDDEEEDNLDAALDVVAKQIRKECSSIEYDHRTYNTKISKDIAGEAVSETLQQLLSKLSLGEQHLPSILVGNIITSAVTKHPTPLQIALAVLLHKKKNVQHMHEYLVCCTYDELLRFKRSSAVAKYNQMCSRRQIPVSAEGLVQVVVDNFDANLSSPNGLVSTHELATIETHSSPPAVIVTDTIPRISKEDMSNPIGFEEEDESESDSSSIYILHGIVCMKRTMYQL